MGATAITPGPRCRWAGPSPPSAKCSWRRSPAVTPPGAGPPPSAARGTAASAFLAGPAGTALARRVRARLARLARLPPGARSPRLAPAARRVRLPPGARRAIRDSLPRGSPFARLAGDARRVRPTRRRSLRPAAARALPPPRGCLIGPGLSQGLVLGMRPGHVPGPHRRGQCHLHAGHDTSLSSRGHPCPAPPGPPAWLTRPGRPHPTRQPHPPRSSRDNSACSAPAGTGVCSPLAMSLTVTRPSACSVLP